MNGYWGSFHDGFTDIIYMNSQEYATNLKTPPEACTALCSVYLTIVARSNCAWK